MSELTKWEYCVTFIRPEQHDTRFKIKEMLNVYGEDGWKMVSVDNSGTVYFKRPICGETKTDEQINY
jgi:hypothetical protein